MYSKMHLIILFFVLFNLSLVYPTYQSTSSTELNLKEWSKLVEVPIDHHPLEYPSLDPTIKSHERVYDFNSPKIDQHSHSNVKNGIDKSRKRKPVLTTGIIETRKPSRRAELKALIETKQEKPEHHAELAKIRAKDRLNKERQRNNKFKRLSKIVDPNGA